MRPPHTLAEAEHDGYPALRLGSPAGLTATYVPTAGMVCASLTHHGDELLGQRQGLGAYAVHGSTMGIPLLHPWANRLARMGYRAGDAVVEFPPGSPIVHDVGDGLPIHGLLAGCPDWRVTGRTADAEAARIEAELDVGGLPDVLALFPFPHQIRLAATLQGRSLTVTTTVRATGPVAVPIAFGYHPYFRLPGVPRPRWEVTLPVRRRMRLDARHLPTGEVEMVHIPPGPLGERTYDDLFVELDPEPTFRLAGGGRTISVVFGEGYHVAVIYAPATTTSSASSP